MDMQHERSAVGHFYWTTFNVTGSAFGTKSNDYTHYYALLIPYKSVYFLLYQAEN